MSPEEQGGQQADQPLIAGALAGDPSELAELARRFALLPRLLSQWNTKRDEPLTEEELVERARGAVIDLWQAVPSYTAAESFNAWLARQSAGCMDFDIPEEAHALLEAALAQAEAPGDSEVRDALALYRAEQALDHAPSTEQRPIWIVFGLLGVAAVFLTLSPLSPWQLQPPTEQPAQVGPSQSAISLITPIGSVSTAQLFRWSSPKGTSCTLVIEDADGREFARATGLSEQSHEHAARLPAGNYRWRVLPSDSDSALAPSPWSDLLVETPAKR